MRIASLFNIRRGLTAVIGGGGKTTLLYRLAEELSADGTVILCTSTKIRRPEHVPCVTDVSLSRLRSLLASDRVVCTGTPVPDGKLSAPSLPFPTLTGLADYVLTEADGSKNLPLKAHAAHEPVIPDNTDQTILVIGADGFGRPIREVCHRPELYSRLAGVSADEPVTPSIAAGVILAEGFGDRVFINKVETESRRRTALELFRLLGLPTAAGSLHEGVYECLC